MTSKKQPQKSMLYTECCKYENNKNKSIDMIPKLEEEMAELTKTIDATFKTISSIDDNNTRNYYMLLGKRNTLQSQIDEIKKTYGSMKFYIKNGDILDKYFNDLDGKSSQHRVNREDLLSQFLVNTNPHYIRDDIIDNSEDYCHKCNKYRELLYGDSVLTCPSCGDEIYTISGSYQLSYRDPPQENVHFSYKRLNHFKDHLARLQAQESTRIPQCVYDVILVEFDKEKKSNLAELDIKLVKKYLKKYISYGYNKYYENAHQIVYKLNGLTPLSIPKSIEEQLCNMFIMIEAPFEKVKSSDRSNIITYPYILYKFCQIREYTDYMKYFNLLKSEDKLNEQDKIWKKICKELDWTYYPTIRL